MGVPPDPNNKRDQGSYGPKLYCISGHVKKPGVFEASIDAFVQSVAAEPPLEPPGTRVRSCGSVASAALKAQVSTTWRTEKPLPLPDFPKDVRGQERNHHDR